MQQTVIRCPQCGCVIGVETTTCIRSASEHGLAICDGATTYYRNASNAQHKGECLCIDCALPIFPDGKIYRIYNNDKNAYLRDDYATRADASKAAREKMKRIEQRTGVRLDLRVRTIPLAAAKSDQKG